jgi:hypothetical protein
MTTPTSGNAPGPGDGQQQGQQHGDAPGPGQQQQNDQPAPQGGQQHDDGQGDQQRDDGGAARELRTALDRERQARKGLESQLAKLQQASMSEQEKAVATARDEGRAEARAEAARELAAAEFRHAATGKIADPDGALAIIDLAKLVTADGQPDRKAIAAIVEQLAAVPQQQQPAGRVPAGPRQPAPQAEGDFLRQAMSQQRRPG